TRAVLLDIVSGQYRFVAQGNAPSTSTLDAAIGLENAISEIERITGRKILTSRNNGPPGVDYMVTTSSLAPPLDTVLVGLVDTHSLSSARRVARSTYTRILDEITLHNSDIDQSFNHLVSQEPELYIITGGTERGAEQALNKLLETVSFAASQTHSGSDAPHVLYAGNSYLRHRAARLFNPSRLVIADNVRPSTDVEQLGSATREIDSIYERRTMLDFSGSEKINELSASIMPTAKAMSFTIEYLSEALDKQANILGVDIGSSSVYINAAIDGEYERLVHAGYGIGHGLNQMAMRIPPSDIMRWLPFAVSEKDVLNHAWMKSAHPSSIPTTQTDLALELAYARELLRSLVKSMKRSSPNDSMLAVDLIFASGSTLTRQQRSNQIVLTLLDSLQPVGLCTMVLDPWGLGSALGAISKTVPEAAVQVIESGAFRELGHVLSPVGKANPGERICQLTIKHKDGSTLEVDVLAGSLEVLPLAQGQQAELEVRPRRRIDVGMGPGEGLRCQVFGSELGLVVDARGRPLEPTLDGGQTMRSWITDIGG
ncbi:MAG: glutamate mutase L, partial [Chloroflexota bacterium]